MNRLTKTGIVGILFILIAPVFASSESDNPFRKVARDVTPVVVQIDTVTKTKVELGRNPFEFFFGAPNNNQDEQPEYREYESKGLGSGIIVEADGKTKYVLTNNHVVENATELTVHFSDGRKYNAELIGNDTRKDLALLKFTTNDDIKVAKLGDSDNLYIGDWALAIGSPLGYESSVTVGIISAIGRSAINTGMDADFTDYIQTDAAINRGNSGGALVNIDGEIIGINTWIASQTGGSIGLGFAIPINNAKKVIRDLIDKGSVDYGWLGVTMSNIPDEIKDSLSNKNQEGAFVSNVFKGSPAEKGGIQPGDIITNVNGKNIKNSDDLLKSVGNLPANVLAKFSIVRNNKAVNFDVYPELRKEESKNALLWPGTAVITLTKDIIAAMNDKLEDKVKDSTKGVVVVSVTKQSSANNVGLQLGDIITHIEGKKISNTVDFYKELANADSEVTLNLIRAGNSLKLIMLNE
ncbi:MAG: Do family serine endopeptidase [Spirochaetales bacterium]|nr:Do family serine endopeptidase [Spirochaetales bacterium]